MFHKNLLLLLFLAFWTHILPGRAQNDDVLHVRYGRVVDAVTRRALEGVDVIGLRADGTPIDTVKTSKNSSVMGMRNIYFIREKARPEAVRFRLEYEGYETLEVPNDTTPYGKAENIRYVKDIALRRKPREQTLGEATVTATKIKFYTKKDTLVFNADAFQLQEGSMLDALIRQLPGVELKDDGRILVNGRQVESLLLNGEQFLDGNRQLMLDNLPSYMVKDVKVYDKVSNADKAMGLRLDKSLVMDVKLKRQYQIGWIANAEGGVTPAKSDGDLHWLGRLFALRFTPQSRITLYGNVNNVNDTRRPGENTEWTPEKMPSGMLTTRAFGMDYLVNSVSDRWKVNGSANFTHSDFRNTTRSRSEIYLPTGGSYWQQGAAQEKTHNVNFSSSHRFEYTRPESHLYLSAQGGATYERYRAGSENVQGTLNESTEGFAAIDSLRRLTLTPWQRRHLLNRALYFSTRRGHSSNSNLGWGGRMQLAKKKMDFLMAEQSVSYSQTATDLAYQRQTDYPATSLATNFHHAFYREHPSHSFNHRFKLNYMIYRSGYGFSLGYALQQSYNRGTREAFRIDRLAGWGAGTGHGLDELPSAEEMYRHTADAENAYLRRDHVTTHSFSPEFFIEKEQREKRLNVQLRLPWNFSRMRTDYQRHTFDGRIQRNTAFFTPSLEVSAGWKDRYQVFITANAYSSSPELTNTILLANEEDPLNIYNGNPALKNTHNYSLNVNYSDRYTREASRLLSLGATYILRKNVIAWAYDYDATTGVRRYTPTNVDGNYLVSFYTNYSFPLDKARHLRLESNFYTQLDHGVDLISQTRSSVFTYWTTENLSLTYEWKKWRFGVQGKAEWNHAASPREDFTPTTAWTFQYGANVNGDLPWGFQLSSDIKMYSRRGIDIPSADRNSLVWNARLSKRLLNGAMTLSVDAFDILGRLSNFTHVMNSQGRFETYRQVLPRYVMFHAVYRLNIKPKKKD